MTVIQNIGGVGNGERGAAIFGLVVEFGDDWRKSVRFLHQCLNTQTSDYLNDSCKHGGLDRKRTRRGQNHDRLNITIEQRQMVYPIIS